MCVEEERQECLHSFPFIIFHCLLLRSRLHLAGQPARSRNIDILYSILYTIYMVELRIKIFFNQDEDGLLGSGTYLNLKLVLNDKK